MREKIAEAINGWGYDISLETRHYMANEILSLITSEIEKGLLTDEAIRDAVIKVSPEARTFMQDMEFIEDFRSVAQAQLDKIKGKINE